MYITVQLAVIIAPTLNDLKAAYESHGDNPLVGRFEVEDSLTQSQIRKLPKDLRERLSVQGLRKPPSSERGARVDAARAS